ncbi:MAG: transglutaminase family protein [Acidimicrobiales bacterium]
MALLVLVCVSALAFGRVYTGQGWQGAAVAPGVTAVVVVALTRRRLRSRAVAAVIEGPALGLSVIWTVVPGSTAAGLPLVRTWHAVGQALAGFAGQFTAAEPPVAPTTAFLLLTGAGVGAAALGSAWLRRTPGLRVWTPLPVLLAFLSSCVLGGSRGRVASVIVETAAVGVYLLVERMAVDADPSRWVAGVRPDAWERRGRVGMRMVVVAAIAAAIASAVPGPDGGGAFGWKSFGGGGTRIIVSPMVSLSTRLTPHNAAADVFSVRSPVPSYWLLTTLDVYSGGTWQAGRASYSSFGVHLPGAGGNAPQGTRQVRETFHIQALDSPWLPLAFHPVAVSGVRDVQYNAGTGSLLTKHATSNGLAYTVTSLQALGTLSRRDLEGAPALGARDVPAGSLALPPTVPSAVVALAHRIVAHAHGEYSKALALQDFFYGPQFTYSLHPPVDGSGIQAIETFLFRTRTGYCQQFAGSYAVMARAVGLPTRVAVGFTTGAQTGPGSYQVTDADVHTWPEVWFPRYGWVPFEPTKGPASGGFAIPGTTAYTGNTARVGTSATKLPSSRTGGGRPGPASAAPTTTVPLRGAVGSHLRGLNGGPGRPGGVVADSGAGAGARLKGGSRLSPAPAPPATSNLTWALAVLLAAGAGVVLLAGANEIGRRRRHRRRRRQIAAAGAGSPEAVCLSWEEMAEALALIGLRRRAWETTPQFARRVAGVLDISGRLTGALAGAAGIVESASWRRDDGTTYPADVTETAREVERLAGLRVRVRDRARLALDTRMAWRPALVDPDGTRAPSAAAPAAP